MSIVTPSEVFEFMQVPSDVNANNTTMITNLITREQSDLEQTLGRKVESTTITDTLFQNWLHCEIFGNELFLKGIYRDLYSITSIEEIGVPLTAVADYNDNNDYSLDTDKGVLIRNLQEWSLAPFAIKITGKLGLVNQSDDTPLNAIKQILVEIVASKSGLWKNNVITEEATIETIRTNITTQTRKQIDKYVLRM